LLEVYYAAKNTAEFDGEAEALLAHLENPDDSLWQRAAEMGRELNPDNPLYSQEPSAAPPVEELAESGEEAFAENDEVTDFEMNFDAKVDAMPEAARDSAEAARDSAEAARDSAEAAVAEKEPTTGAEIGFSDAELEYDLTVADATAESEEEEDNGEGILSSADEAATKLDLARAYIEMGDPDGARSILQEVVEEGDDGQKLEAEDLMSQIA
jgi:pilus assembly protein FimV